MKNDNITKATEMLKQFNDTNINEKKSNARRSRLFSLTSYIDIKELETLCKHSSIIAHYALILHDKDIKDDGTAKQQHSHIILYTYDAKTCTAILKHFDRLALSLDAVNPQNTLCEYGNDAMSLWRYLRHADDAHKHQYPITDIICDDLRYWQNLEKTDGMTLDNDGLSMVQDLLDGVSYRIMCERYGKDFIYHARYVEEMRAKIAWEESHLSQYAFDENMFRLVLSQNYTEFDISKFMSMLAYVKQCFSVDFNNGKAVDFYLKG